LVVGPSRFDAIERSLVKKGKENRGPGMGLTLSDNARRVGVLASAYGISENVSLVRGPAGEEVGGKYGWNSPATEGLREKTDLAADCFSGKRPRVPLKNPGLRSC
jgi:hypothetical protein